MTDGLSNRVSCGRFAATMVQGFEPRKERGGELGKKGGSWLGLEPMPGHHAQGTACGKGPAEPVSMANSPTLRTHINTQRDSNFSLSLCGWRSGAKIASAKRGEVGVGTVRCSLVKGGHSGHKARSF